MLQRLVDTRFQGLFTPLAGVLFAFPSWYSFTIGRQVVFSLGRWSSQIPTGFLGPRGTQEPLGRPGLFRLRGYHPLWPDFPDGSARDRFGNFLEAPPHFPNGPTTPNAQRRQACMHFGLGMIPVRSPLLGESRLMSVPGGTKMFQFPPLALLGL